ncbi:MAG: RNA polymerase sigma factor [Deltaproteobacteria bacterium]|nr:RNA polymerase sigma factor [Deltaproteobacteria bacterium]
MSDESQAHELRMETDRELLLRLSKGERTAFDAVFERHRSGLYSFLFRLCRDRSTAEDLFQETWLRLARGAASLPSDTPIGPWLFRVARNLAVSHHRRVSLYSKLEGFLRPTPLATPHERAETVEVTGRVERAVHDLPLRDREVILLVVVEGMSAKEAGLVLGISAEATRQRLSRARSALKEQLADLEV